MSSGFLADVSIFKTKYKDYMNVQEARLLCMKAIEAWIYQDLVSGNNVDLCIITSNGAKMERNIKIGQCRMSEKKIAYQFRQGDTRNLINSLFSLKLCKNK